MKWGLFGGTFDPVHLGHLRCAEEILELFALDKIFFIPNHVQPLKTAGGILPFHHRAQMLRLAIENNPSFDISSIEATRGGKSYSIETIRYFLGNSPEGTDLYFILGQDAFHDIQRWKDWQELLQLCHFVVMTRPGHKTKTLKDILPPDTLPFFEYNHATDSFEGPAGRVLFFRTLTLMDISSTDIRNRVREGRSIRYLVPEPVHEYILRKSDGDYFSHMK